MNFITVILSVSRAGRMVLKYQLKKQKSGVLSQSVFNQFFLTVITFAIY